MWLSYDWCLARKEIMSHLQQAQYTKTGTLSGNPLAMAAGYSIVKTLHNNPSIYVELERTTAILEEGLTILFEKGVSYSINRVGSMISLHFCETLY